MPRMFVATLALTFTGCGAPAMAHRAISWHHMPLRIVSDDATGMVDNGILWWNTTLGQRAFVRVPGGRADVLVDVNAARPAGAPTAGICQHMMFGSTRTDYVRVWSHLAGWCKRIVLLHELGHVLELEHTVSGLMAPRPCEEYPSLQATTLEALVVRFFDHETHRPNPSSKAGGPPQRRSASHTW